jgi:hypothetical protein
MLRVLEHAVVGSLSSASGAPYQTEDLKEIRVPVERSAAEKCLRLREM